MGLHQILKNRLKQRTNKRFVKWRAENKKIKTNELHHLLDSFLGGRKQNDYLLAEISEQLHKKITYEKHLNEDEFINLFVESLEFVFDYIEMLENNNVNNFNLDKYMKSKGFIDSDDHYIGAEVLYDGLIEWQEQKGK